MTHKATPIMTMPRRILVGKALLVLLAIIFTAYIVVTDQLTTSRIFAALFSFMLPFSVDILAAFRIRIPEKFEFLFLVFLLFAMFFGIDFQLYRLVPYYDKFIHAISGAFTFVLGLMIADSCGLQARRYIDARLVFAIMVSVTIAFLWECYEFAADSFVGTHMQTLISTGPADTMLDLIFACLGALAAAIVLAVTTRSSR
jgi:hypothetical protein